MKSIDPMTGKVIKSYTEHSLKEIEKMLQHGHKAYRAWRTVSFEERAVKMKAAAEILRQKKEALARLMAQEMGKPLAQGEGEIEKCAWGCEFYAEKAAAFLAAETVQTEAHKSFIAYEPLGVILAIMPWNFPFWQVFRCAAPVLMAGDTIILKHASNVCGCALAIESIFKEAGFPDRVFQTVLAGNEKIGKVIAHPLVQAVTLTGSVGAGKAVASRAGGVIKKTVMELGGSDPYLVLEDADLEKTVQTCAASRMINGGQSCIAAKRFIVVKSVLKDFEKRFVELMESQRMGPPLDRETTLGPLARHDLRDSIHEQVKKSLKKGARLFCGGKVPESPAAFYPPTVLGNVRPGMPAYEEELFGPVASIIGVRDETEGIAVANGTIFGLGAAVFTADIERGERIATQELQAGCCFVNDFVKSDPRLPFGGIKQSGYGRELSVFGIREFVNIKTVSVK